MRLGYQMLMGLLLAATLGCTAKVAGDPQVSGGAVTASPSQLASGTPDPSFQPDSSWMTAPIPVLSSLGNGGFVLGIDSYGANGELKGQFSLVSSVNATDSQGHFYNAVIKTTTVPIQTVITSFNADGSINETFNGGTLTYNTSVGAPSIAVQPDGNILTVVNSNGTSFHFVRYLNDGQLDTSYGTNGSSVTISGQVSQAVCQPDGNLLLAGNFFNGTPNPVSRTLVRLTSSGAIDTSFGFSGQGYTVISPVNDGILGANISDLIRSVAVSNGEIYASVQHTVETATPTLLSAFSVARLALNGTSDTTFEDPIFHVPGFAVFPLDPSTVTIISNGTTSPSVYAENFYFDSVGRTISAVGSTGGTLTITRYLSTGKLDSSFGSGSSVTFPYVVTNPGAYRLLVNPDNSILVYVPNQLFVKLTP